MSPPTVRHVTRLACLGEASARRRALLSFIRCLRSRLRPSARRTLAAFRRLAETPTAKTDSSPNSGARVFSSLSGSVCLPPRSRLRPGHAVARAEQRTAKPGPGPPGSPRAPAGSGRPVLLAGARKQARSGVEGCNWRSGESLPSGFLRVGLISLAWDETLDDSRYPCQSNQDCDD